MADLLLERGLPQVEDIERLVLGAVLVDDTLLHDVRPALAEDDFAIEKHRRIWRHVTKLYDAGGAVDYATVATALIDAGELESVDGISYLVSLSDGIPVLCNVSAYVGIVKEKAERRRLAIGLYTQFGRALATDPIQDIRDAVGSLAADVAPVEAGKGLVSARDLVDRVGVNQILAPRASRGVPFPWPWMNHATCGMLPGELWILAAHTSVGKTSAAIQTAVHVARSQAKAVAVFSLEMRSEPVFRRAVWQSSRVNSQSANWGTMTADERGLALAAANDLRELPLYFDDGSYSVMEIHARLRSLRARSPLGLGLVVVDYLQLLRDGGRHGSRAEAVGANARALKLLAGEFECPVLLLSQFSRESAKPNGSGPARRPVLWDLKESGDIENHANGVWFIHPTEQSQADMVRVEFILPKQREGQRNVWEEFWFFPKYQRFDELARDGGAP